MPEQEFQAEANAQHHDGGMDIDVAEVVEVKRVTIARGSSQRDAVEPSVLCARQLTAAIGGSQLEPLCEKTDPPTLPEPLREKVESAVGAGDDATRDAEELQNIQTDVPSVP